MATKKQTGQRALQLKSVSAIFNFSAGIKVAILLLFALGFYANSIHNRYALDDEAVIQSNVYVEMGFSGIGKILTSDAYDSYYRIHNSNQHLSGGRYRPLSIVLFAIEYQIWGESPQKGHLVNVLLYILCVLSVFYFLRKYLFKRMPYGEDIAFISSLLFVIHPIHTEVVDNIKSSDEILSLLFIMLTLIFSIKHRETKRILYLVAGLLCFFLALLSKEYGLMLLVLLPILFSLYYREKLLESIKSSLPYYGIIAFYFIMRIASIGFPHQQGELDVLNNPYLFATPMQKIASEIFILGKYLFMLFIPYPLSYDYGFAQIPYHSFSSPLVWLSIIAYVVIIYWGVKLWKRKNMLAFLIFFFLLNMLMVSNLFLNIGATMGERLAFHSSLGFVSIVAFGVVEFIKKVKMQQRLPVLVVFLSGLIILSGMEVVKRNKDWSSNFMLFTKDVNTVPNSVKANDNAGGQYVNLSETIKDTIKSDSITRIGLKYLHKAVALDDSDMDGYLDLGIAYCKLLQPDSAKYYWDMAKRIYPGQPDLPGYYSLAGYIFAYKARQIAQKGEYKKAIFEFEKGLECNPTDPDIWVNLGGTFFNLHQYDSARYDWQKVEKMNPNYPNLKTYFAMLPKSDTDSNSSPGFK